jgi:nitrite reductase/ring-hydroxylating ferredoxin subunit
MSGAARAAEYLAVAAASEVCPDAATIVKVGRYDVALFRLNEEIFAYENACPHQGGPIGEGIVEAGTVTCPWHAWCFDVRSGMLTLGDFARLRSFRVLVDGEMVYVAREPDPGA